MVYWYLYRPLWARLLERREPGYGNVGTTLWKGRGLQDPIVGGVRNFRIHSQVLTVANIRVTYRSVSCEKL
jgi:hypothetical protein